MIHDTKTDQLIMYAHTLAHKATTGFDKKLAVGYSILAMEQEVTRQNGLSFAVEDGLLAITYRSKAYYLPTDRLEIKMSTLSERALKVVNRLKRKVGFTKRNRSKRYPIDESFMNLFKIGLSIYDLDMKDVIEMFAKGEG